MVLRRRLKQLPLLVLFSLLCATVSARAQTDVIRVGAEIGFPPTLT
jgi:hypothetical protein